MDSVLVTGASGWIGRGAVTALRRRGFEVHGVGRGAAPPDVHSWERADLLRGDAVERVAAAAGASHLLHLAWYAEPGAYVSSPLNLDWLGASARLIRAFTRAGGSRIVAAGTCLEDLAVSSMTSYAACKRGLRDALIASVRSQAVSVAWGRIFHLYGPEEDPRRLVPSVMLAILRDGEAKCTDGGQVRDYLHVRDVAEAFANLVDSNAQGTFDIASGRGVSVADVARMAATAAGAPERLRLGALPTPPAERLAIIGDPTRLFDETSWRPRINIGNGMHETAEWWRTQLQKGEIPR